MSRGAEAARGRSRKTLTMPRLKNWRRCDAEDLGVRRDPRRPGARWHRTAARRRRRSSAVGSLDVAPRRGVGRASPSAGAGASGLRSRLTRLLGEGAAPTARRCPARRADGHQQDRGQHGGQDRDGDEQDEWQPWSIPLPGSKNRALPAGKVKLKPGPRKKAPMITSTAQNIRWTVWR